MLADPIRSDNRDSVYFASGNMRRASANACTVHCSIIPSGVQTSAQVQGGSVRRAMVSLNSACVAGAEPGSPLSDEEAMQTAVSGILSHARVAVSGILSHA